MVKRRQPGRRSSGAEHAGRLPFDPGRVAGPAPTTPPPAGAESAPDEERPLSVSELAAAIDGALKRGLPRTLRVVGEISGFRDRTHWWFDLKDEQAVISCVMFASDGAKSGLSPRNGQEVVVSGRIEHYARQGRTQMYVTRMSPVGEGALERRYRALVEELRALGYFDPARKKPLPWFPRRVAVVTSRTGAALQDVLATMRKRCPAVEVVVVDVLVQGAEAAPGVAAAINRLSRDHGRLGVDAIILTRGGGSMEDLWAFNERIVADAIHRCDAPIVAAIGHETDVTIAELVADERCATPTQAAMRLTPDRADLEQQNQMMARRLEQALRSAAQGSGARLERLAARLAAVRPDRVLAEREARLRELDVAMTGALRAALGRIDLPGRAERLDRALRSLVERRTATLEGLARTLGAVGPASVLARGFSVTLRPDGRIVRRPGDVREGDRIETRLAEGAIRSIVARDQGAAHAPRRPRKGRDGPDGLELFTPAR